MEKEQINIKGVSAEEFAAFQKLFHRDHLPVKSNTTEDGHFVVCFYGEGKDKFNVCYDTKADMMQATAEEEILNRIKSCLYTAKSQSFRAAPSASVDKPNTLSKGSHASTESVDRDARQNSARVTDDRNKTAVVTDVAKQKPRKERSKSAKREKRETNMRPADPKNALAVEPKIASPDSDYKDGYSLAKFTPESLERSLSSLRANDSVKEIIEEETQPNTPRHLIKFTIKSKTKEKAIVQYAVKRQVVQIQGKPSVLTDLVQSVLSNYASVKEIIQARAEYNRGLRRQPEPLIPAEPKVTAPEVPVAPVKSGKKEKVKKEKTVRPKKVSTSPEPNSIQKSLAKSLPNGVLYLSKQSQTYLFYALTDLGSNLSNYGGILATAYQGLENLISNLQQTEKIKVKMIGQAYEKEDGQYTLKASYRKKIHSIVFNEVMSALYTEYFDKRHFYTHSDNFSDTARVLSDQKAAKAELNRLMALIEYNCTKLKEIGFRIDNAVIDQPD